MFTCTILEVVEHIVLHSSHSLTVVYRNLRLFNAHVIYRLYNDPKQRPKYNVVFVLSGAGSFNYFGTKNMLDDQLDDPGENVIC